MSVSETSQLGLSEIEARLCSLPVVQSVISALKAQLSKNLCYHTVEHTLDVFHEALLFAHHDNLPARDMELLAIAAAYHDAGFLQQPKDNERIGARMAADAMRKHSYPRDEISTVETMIDDTQLRPRARGFAQVPTHELSRYLLDADLSNFGRDDFFEKAELVRKEIGVPKNRASLKKVLLLMQAHQWHTPAAKALRQKKKEENLARLRETLAAMKGR